MQKMLRDKKVICLFVLPVVIIFTVFIPVPLITSLLMGFVKWDLLGEPKFIGLSNFITMFTVDDIFQQSIFNTAYYLVLSIILQIPAAIFLAILLTRGHRGDKFFSNAIFMPEALSGTAVALMFYFIYHPDGILNSVIQAMGFPDFHQAWLADERTAMAAVCVRVAWQYIGYHMVIYISGISGISHDYIEAAKIDGANILQISRHVILPLMKPVVKVSLILITTSSLKSFDSIFVMTKGGPMNATEVIASHMYNKAFLQLNYGYGSAIGIVLFLMCVICTGIITALFTERKRKAG